MRRKDGLYRRGKKGTFWLQWRGTRQSLGTTDREVAELAKRDIERRAADPTYRAANETTLGVALKDFKARQAQRGRSAGTLRMYDAHIGHLARVLGEHEPLASIDAEQVDHYLSARYDEGASSQTRWKELCTLRGALKLARRHRKYPHALDQVMPETFEGAQSKPGTGHLTMPQIDRLLAKLPEERAAVVAFIVATAADWRSVELAEPGDIDVKRGEALVRGSKTSHRWRTIPILPQFRALAERAAKALPFESWGNVRRDLEVACKRAKVPYATPRDLRRSHGRMLRAQGVEPHLIGKMLGHRDSRMVELVYGQLPPDALGKLMLERTGTNQVQKKRRPSRKRGKNATPRAARAD